MGLLLAAAVGLAAPVPADAEPGELVGRASVIDGDTLEIRGARVRLHGIDAPEASQLCEAAGRRWPCGRVAAQRLADFIGGATVACRGSVRDRYGRLVGTCVAHRVDLGGWLVRHGWALAYRRYALDYVGDERGGTRHRRRSLVRIVPGALGL